MTPQNFSKGRKEREKKAFEEDFILALVREERAHQPRLGGRKLHVKLAPRLKKAGLSIGRDSFFELLGRHGLLLERARRSVPRTTDSRHRLYVYGNLLASRVLTAPGQAWVADITYLETEGSFVYLSLVMDAFSRKIVGYDVGETLEAIGALRALSMAQATLRPGQRPLHHSDRGTQYCCRAYIEALAALCQEISMTEANHCYENGKAERLNGILKQEYGLGGVLRDFREALLLVREAVRYYNNERPHQALGYATPAAVHAQKRSQPTGLKSAF